MNNTTQIDGVFDHQKMSSIGFFKADLHGHCTFNSYILKLLNNSAPPSTLSTLTDAIHIDDQVLFYNAWAQMLKDKHPLQLDLRLKSHADCIYRIHLEIVPNLTEKNEISDLNGVIIDKTPQFRAEEFLRLHHWKLNEVDELFSEDEALASITHELNQPLSVVSIYIQRAIERLTELKIEDDTLNMALNKIKTLIDRSTRILSDIRGFFNTDRMKLVNTDFNTMLNHALETLNGGLIGKVKIHRDLQSPPQPLMVDDFQIEQVIVNLVKNACEAMHMLAPEKATLTFKSYTHDNWTYLSISDNGIGIPKEIQKNIFTPFTTSKICGMGMGLPISRSICQAHGGELILENSSDHGTTFVIKLPLKS